MTRTFFKETLTLLPDRAVFLESSRAVVIADLHLGKAAGFRANGIPIPEGDNLRDLERVSRLVEQTQAQQVVVAGDLIHSRDGLTRDLLLLLRSWANSLPARVTLVTGNHDTSALRGEDLGFERIPRLKIGGAQIVHDPADSTSAEDLVLCGHIHPVIHIQERRRRAMRVPCFWLVGNVLTLPAFGTFTGGFRVSPNKKDRVFTPIGQRVAEIPAQLVKCG